MEFYRMTQGEFQRYCYYRDVIITSEWQHSRYLAGIVMRVAGVKNVQESKILPLWPDFLHEEEKPKQVIKGGKDLEEFLASRTQNP